MKETQERGRITIIGLGLIGGSLGLAIKAAGLRGGEMVGHARRRQVASKARKIGAIDRAEHNLPRAVAQARMVVIAPPVLAIREVMRQIAPDLPEGCVVTDVGSTKERVLEWAAELLPPSVSFVGGHPMAGKETPGIDNAEADLFRGRAPPPLAPPPLASAAGSDLAPMASSGFRDVTRLASGDPQMSHDIFLTNREAAVHWLERMIEELRHYRGLLGGGAA